MAKKIEQIKLEKASQVTVHGVRIVGFRNVEELGMVIRKLNELIDKLNENKE